MKITFEKYDNGRWYAVIPEWPDDIEELEMVEGADTMLDNLSTDGFTAQIEFIFDETPAKPHDYIRCDLTFHDDMGGTYEPEPNEYFNSSFWLCNVTHFVCGEHPEVIWLRPLT